MAQVERIQIRNLTAVHSPQASSEIRVAPRQHGGQVFVAVGKVLLTVSNVGSKAKVKFAAQARNPCIEKSSRAARFQAPAVDLTVYLIAQHWNTKVRSNTGLLPRYRIEHTGDLLDVSFKLLFVGQPYFSAFFQDSIVDCSSGVRSLENIQVLGRKP